MQVLIGKTIDNYKLLELVGKGGMGLVFRAEDVSLEKIVAVKMLNPVFSDDTLFLNYFKREGKALARLDNSNIVRIFALRKTEYGLMLIMEFVEGEDLESLIKRSGALESQRGLNIFQQLLKAVGYAHSAGVLHRDIKPRNILICANDIVKITDFGLAKITKGDNSSLSSVTAGTLHYMSPEQIEGLPNIDERTDIYSLGITFYEMLCGCTPFQQTDSDFTIRKKIVAGQLPSIKNYKSGIPQEIEKIVNKCIKKDRAERYQNTAEIQSDLDEIYQRPSKDSRDSDIDTIILKEKKKKSRGKNVKLRPLFFLLVTVLFLYAGKIFYESNFNRHDTQSQNTTSKVEKVVPPQENNLIISPIVLALSKISDTDSLLKVLNDYNKTMHITLGRMQDFLRSENSYVVVVDSSKVWAMFQYKNGNYINIESGEIFPNLSEHFRGKSSIWLKDNSAYLSDSERVQ